MLQISETFCPVFHTGEIVVRGDCAVNTNSAEYQTNTHTIDCTYFYSDKTKIFSKSKNRCPGNIARLEKNEAIKFLISAIKDTQMKK